VSCPSALSRARCLRAVLVMQHLPVHHDGVHPPVTNVWFPWHRDAHSITELTASDNLVAVMRRF
jgi:hypothetical protein